MNWSRMLTLSGLSCTVVLATLGWCPAAESTESGQNQEVAIKARVVGEDVPPAPLTSGSAASAESVQSLIPKLTEKELQALVAPLALYPDEVLDNILEAAQHPAAIHQGANLHRAGSTDSKAAVVREDLPRSVQYLLNKHPSILLDLDRDLLMVARLGSAVKVQPEDVVAAIREVRAQAAAFAAQYGDTVSTQALSYRLPAVSAYYGNGGVYSGTVYPCYTYYTYGLPAYYYAYPYYTPLAWANAAIRLAAGITWLATYPFDYPYPYPYPYPFPYYARWWGWWGYYPYYPLAYVPYGWSYFGPYARGAHYASVTYGPYGGAWYAGTTTGVFYGPRGATTFTTYGKAVGYSTGPTSVVAGAGSGTFTGPYGTVNVAGAGMAGKTTIGNTTLFGGAGSATFSTSRGLTGTLAGMYSGNVTVVGNATSWHTQAAGSLQTNTGINALATHTGGGSLVAYANGTYGYNRASSTTLSGNQGAVTIDHSAQAHIVGGGQGSYSGTTTITGSGGQQVTINTTYQDGQLNIDKSKTGQPSSTSTAAQRLSGQTGVDQRFASLSAQNAAERSVSMAGERSTGGLLGGLNAAPRPAASSDGTTRAAGIGSRFGGYGALNTRGSSEAGQSSSRLSGSGAGGLQGPSGTMQGSRLGSSTQTPRAGGTRPQPGTPSLNTPRTPNVSGGTQRSGGTQGATGPTFRGQSPSTAPSFSGGNRVIPSTPNIGGGNVGGGASRGGAVGGGGRPGGGGGRIGGRR